MISSDSSSKGEFIYCSCGSLAQLRTTKNGVNAGKEYWSCARDFKDPQRCKFFMWNPNNNNNSSFSLRSSSSMNHSSNSNTFQTSKAFTITTTSDRLSTKNPSNSSSNSSNDVQIVGDDVISAPLCPKHQIACIQRRVVKEGPTKGRLFWTCTAAQNCHFEWCREGTKPALYLDNPSSSWRGGGGGGGGAFTSTMIESNIKLGPPYLINFQLVGSNILQQANKQLKDRHETLSIQKDNYDCILLTFPRIGTITNKLIKSLNDLFDKKITKFNDLEFIIPLTEHATLKKFLLETRVEGAHIIISDFPEGTKIILNHYPAIDLSNVDALCEELNFKDKFPKYVYSKLRPFQKQGIAFAVKRDGKVLFGDEMGVGKTLQGFSTMYYFKQDWPLLIICPSSLKHNWGKEIEDWFITGEKGHSDITTENIKIIENGKQIPDGYINIISYTIATNMLAENPQDEHADGAILNGVKFKCVICDESHSLKNTSTKRSQKIVPFLQKVERLVMITGTPALSRPKELFPQLSLLLDREFRFTKTAFTTRYCDAKETLHYVDDNGSSNVMELNYLLSRTVMIRRRKETVLSELPPKQRQQVLLTISPNDLKRIKYSAEKMKNAIEKMKHAMTKQDHFQHNFDKNSEIFRMYNMTGVAKLPAVKEYIADMIENTGDLKFLVFAYHTEVLDGVEECVAKELAKFYQLKFKESELEKKMRGDYYIRIDGSTDSNRRQSLVTNFKQNGHCRVAILSIKAAGVGYTMTPCSTVLFAELYWTPSDLRQAEDRVHRIGQKDSVHIKYLLGKGTFDEYMWPMLQRKLDVVGKSVDGESHVDENVQQVEFERRRTLPRCCTRNDSIMMDEENDDEENDEEDNMYEEEEHLAEMYEHFEEEGKSKSSRRSKVMIRDDNEEDDEEKDPLTTSMDEEKGDLEFIDHHHHHHSYHHHKNNSSKNNSLQKEGLIRTTRKNLNPTIHNETNNKNTTMNNDLTSSSSSSSSSNIAIRRTTRSSNNNPTTNSSSSSSNSSSSSSSNIASSSNNNNNNTSMCMDMMTINNKERKCGLDILRQLMHLPKNGESLPPNVRDAMKLEELTEEHHSREDGKTALLKTLSSLSSVETKTCKTFNRSFRDDDEKEEEEEKDDLSLEKKSIMLLKKRNRSLLSSDSTEEEVSSQTTTTTTTTTTTFTQHRSSLLPQTPTKKQSPIMKTSPFFKNPTSSQHVVTQPSDEESHDDLVNPDKMIQKTEENVCKNHKSTPSSTPSHILNDSSLSKFTNAFKRTTSISTTTSSCSTTTTSDPSMLMMTTFSKRETSNTNHLSTTTPPQSRPSPRLLMNSPPTTTTTTPNSKTFTPPPPPLPQCVVAHSTTTTSSIPSIPSPVGNSSTKSSPSASSNLAQLFEKYSFKREVTTTTGASYSHSTPSKAPMSLQVNNMRTSTSSQQTKQQVPLVVTPPIRTHTTPNKITNLTSPRTTIHSLSSSAPESSRTNQENQLEPETKKIKTESHTRQEAPLLDDDFILDDEILPDMI
ncbi:hypothetical protein FDP41_009033 [Naegleria fowleri]|uniref:Uncharacterized protein n=1 Tax=Naegleria fowleri TaxID=5763 RepID=A0A6A5BFH7_NAEFO|nr:uncharacterized protein FDP41_009033 [Naegleria fowleri]KAF0972784.1 hypothetical protein FDP41_009033 [Naegleria fowleri]